MAKARYVSYLPWLWLTLVVANAEFTCSYISHWYVYFYAITPFGPYTTLKIACLNNKIDMLNMTLFSILSPALLLLVELV